MTTLTGPRPSVVSKGRRTAAGDARFLVDAAARGDLETGHARGYRIYLLNGRENPDIRTLVVKLLTDGVLEVADPAAETSLIVPVNGATR